MASSSWSLSCAWVFLAVASLLLSLTVPFSAQATTTGPNSPGTVVSDATLAGTAWTNPTNAQASDNVYATNFTACFVGGTLIKTPFGEVPIEDIQPGQSVYGFDEEQHLVVAQVSDIHLRQTEDLVVVMTDSGLVITTPEHPFYVGDGAFAIVRDLKVGDVLYDSAFAKHSLLLKTTLQMPSTVPVYNLTVDGVHTFFANGFPVHNK